MINYLTTVQLKDAEQNDYDKLDAEMSKEAFERANLSEQVKKPSSPFYREYKYSGGITIQKVTAAAYRAGSRIGKKYSFTVIKNKA